MSLRIVQALIALSLLAPGVAGAGTSLVAEVETIRSVDFPMSLPVPAGGTLLSSEPRRAIAGLPGALVVRFDIETGELARYPGESVTEVLARRGLGAGYLSIFDEEVRGFRRPHSNEFAAGVLDEAGTYLFVSERAYLSPAADLDRIDSDRDGLSDGEEVGLHATDPLDSDTDNDGLSDGEEVASGGDPLVPDFELVARYDFSEGAGPVRGDSAGPVNTAAYASGGGLLYGAAPIPDGTYGAFQLSNAPLGPTGGNTTGTWVTAGAAELGALINDFTLMAWVRPDSTQGRQRIHSRVTGGTGGWGFGFDGGELLLTGYDVVDSLSSGASLASGQWQHVAVSKSSSEGIRFYLNGAEVSHLQGQTGDYLASDGEWALLGRDGFEDFAGRVDEVRVYRSPLLATQITAVAVDALAPLVEDDFEVVDGGGRGWAAGSGWGGNLDYLEANPIEPGGHRHARTRDGVHAFRAIDASVAAALDASSQVWIALDVRLDHLKNDSEFAGVSIFGAEQERFYLGALFANALWGANSFVCCDAQSATPAGAEWIQLMVHLDFAEGLRSLYMDGQLAATDSSMPQRAWDQVRIASGGSAPENRVFVDRLRIGTTRVSVEPPRVPKFVAVSVLEDSLVFLDGHRQPIASFPAAEADPNGVASDGTQLYSGHFITDAVVAYAGGSVQPLYVWSTVGDPVGLASLPGELVVASFDTGFDFYDPGTGELLRSLAYTCQTSGFVEGVAWDGTVLWASCGGGLEAIDPVSGGFLGSIANAAAGCGATAISASAPGELTLGCPNGDWFRVSSANGDLIDSGNNGVNQFGLAYLPEAGSWLSWVPCLAVLAGLAMTRRPRPS